MVPQLIGRMLTPAEVSAAGGGSGQGLATPQGSSGTAGAPFTPAQIRHAYGVDQLSYDGTGQTIGIIDAYAQSSATVTSELNAFSTAYGLPAANLTVVTPTGNPQVNAGWDLEIALDVEWAHAIAPGAKILLYESAAASDSSLLAGVDYARTNGANQISMSWGGGEWSTESSWDSYFNHPGVTFLASSGDTASELLFPAVSPYVTSVGGTFISLDTSANKLTESAWSSGGGGVSNTYAKLPAYQQGFLSSAYRGTPDVAYNADPNSGVPVDDNGTYYQVGGTSAGSPQWAGLVALANQGLVANGKPTLGTGQSFGTNSVLYQLAGGTSYTNPKGDFLDITSGSNGHAATPGYDLATGLGSPVANVLVPDLVGPTQAPPTAPTPGDAGFEAVAMGPGSFQYGPSGSAWTFSGAGVSANNSAFTSGNPAAPQASQVAFLQNKGTITQAVAGWAAGSYTVSFQAAQRGNNGTSVEDFQILVDGNLVGTFKPTGTAYQSYSTASFAVGAGSHAIQFVGLDSAGGDNTAFLDAVAVTASASAPPTAPTPGDAGFEAVAMGPGSFQYGPSGSAWTFSGAGVSANNSAFTSGNPAAPQASQVAFLQNKGTITQAVAGWAAGSYTVSFQAAQRGNNGTSVEDFQILVDGNLVGTFKPTGTAYQSYSTASFAVGAGSHAIQFVGLDSAGGDNTAFLDAVAVTASASAPPTAPTPGDAGFEAVAMGPGSFQYGPSGSAWTFSGAGVSANNSAFTSGNPAAPQGAQVAFIQGQGTITQAVAGWAAGSYTVSLLAAQRGNNGTSVENFRILIDGNLVGTLQPTGPQYQSYTTQKFTVTAGSHTIQLVGMNSAGGDNTAFLDNVTVASS